MFDAATQNRIAAVPPIRPIHPPLRIDEHGVARIGRSRVTLETIRFLAETGVNFISVGRITQSAPAVDIGLDYALA